jgi:BlaI family transcriptional regulator, penicillinase repressor
MAASHTTIDDLGSLQRAVVEILWEDGEASVQAVRDRLPGDPAYTTVLSVLQKLEKSGWVRHRRDGRAYIYAPKRSREQAGAASVRTFVDRVFGGDPIRVLQHLLQDNHLSDDDLSALRALIAERAGDAATSTEAPEPTRAPRKGGRR